MIEGLNSYVHAFLPKSPEIEFGAITPKGDYVTINIAGIAVDRPAMQRFLALPEVHAVLPDFAARRSISTACRCSKGAFRARWRGIIMAIAM